MGNPGKPNKAVETGPAPLSEKPRPPAENDRPVEGVTSVEPGCTCGGIAACPQCQERDEVIDRVARLLCERHQFTSPTRQPCAACVQDAAGCVLPPGEQQ